MDYGKAWNAIKEACIDAIAEETDNAAKNAYITVLAGMVMAEESEIKKCPSAGTPRA